MNPTNLNKITNVKNEKKKKKNKIKKKIIFILFYEFNFFFLKRLLLNKVTKYLVQMKSKRKVFIKASQSKIIIILKTR